MWRIVSSDIIQQQEQIIEMYLKLFCCNISIRIAYKWHHSRISLCISQTGTSQTAGARNKGGNFIGQLCISVVPYCTFWFIDCCRSCTDVLFVEKRNEIVQFRNIVRLLSQTSVAENTNANLFIKVVIS